MIDFHVDLVWDKKNSYIKCTKLMYYKSIYNTLIMPCKAPHNALYGFMNIKIHHLCYDFGKYNAKAVYLIFLNIQ